MFLPFHSKEINNILIYTLKKEMCFSPFTLMETFPIQNEILYFLRSQEIDKFYHFEPSTNIRLILKKKSFKSILTIYIILNVDPTIY